MVKAASVDNVKTQNLQTSSPIVAKKKKLNKHKKALSAVKTVKTAEGALLSPEPNLQGTLNNVEENTMSLEAISARYPVLNDEQLVKRFLEVPMNNNQKGRLRLQIKDKLKGTSNVVLPDIIYNRIQAILKSSTNLTDTDLRKIRILYNMLTTAMKTESSVDAAKSKKVKTTKTEAKEGAEVKNVEKREKMEKVLKKKRYVVFLGNLPLNIDKEKIMGHFAELGDQVVDVRIPKRKQDAKSAIAYVELSNEPTFELALSKHHSMLNNRRINVLYSAQKTGKMITPEAKSKAAKMVALQKSGQLLGSIPANRKRSYRRNKMKRALAKKQQEENA